MFCRVNPSSLQGHHVIYVLVPGHCSNCWLAPGLYITRTEALSAPSNVYSAHQQNMIRLVVFSSSVTGQHTYTWGCLAHRIVLVRPACLQVDRLIVYLCAEHCCHWPVGPLMSVNSKEHCSIVQAKVVLQTGLLHKLSSTAANPSHCESIWPVDLFCAIK